MSTSDQSAHSVLYGLTTVVTKYAGAGNPPADAPFTTPQNFYTHLEPTLKCLYALGPLFAFGYSLPKISLLLFYLRVFIGRKVRFSIWLMMAIVVLEMLAFLIAAILYCIPVPYYWHRQGSGHCFDADTFYRATSGIKVVLDLGLVLLPLYPLWQLQVSTLKKVGLSCVFMTSVIGVFGGLIRFIFLLVYTISDITPATVSRLVSIIIVEPNLFFIAACLPACNSLFMEILRHPRVRALLHLPSTQGHEGQGQSSSYFDRSRQQKARNQVPDDAERLVGAEYVRMTEVPQSVKGGVSNSLHMDEDDRRGIALDDFRQA
ncbi:MAG: hypothetical protein Q9159_000789 [Coniocarpon cinnabarinum]